MNLNGMLYDFIDNLNKAVKIGEDEYSANFESEEFTAVEKETGETVKTRIMVFENEFDDADDRTRYSYWFGLKNIDIEEIDAYEFSEPESAAVIKNYARKIRYFIDNQKREMEKRLYDLFQFMLKIDNGTFIGKYQM